MRTMLILVALVFVVPSIAFAEQPVRVFAGQPGPYEVHTWQHRTNNFDRAPYFATNPPVYYGDQRVVRSYGWTPYPYLGTNYPVARAISPMKEPATEKAPVEKVSPTNKKKEKRNGRA